MNKQIRSRNEGSIWQDRDRWRAAVSLDGKRITKSFRSKPECQVWNRETLNQADETNLYIQGVKE